MVLLSSKKNTRHLYFLRKSGRYLFIFFIILTLNFLIPRIMPGDPIRNLLGDSYEAATEDDIIALKIQYGLEQSLPLQYGRYIKNMIHGDFGYSIVLEKPVIPMISEALRYTLLLVFPAVILSGILSLFLGALAGYKRNSGFDKIVTSLALFLYTTPSFFLAMLFVSIFSYHLGWFPFGHITSGNISGFGLIFDVFCHLLLPISIITLLGTLSKFMVVRSSTIQILDDFFVFVLKSKGYSSKKIVTRHVIKNVLPQFISMMALSFGFMVSGSLLVEIVFSIDGMGGLIFQAVTTRDYPVIQGAFLVITITVLIANFVADMLYAVADPRIGDSQESIS